MMDGGTKCAPVAVMIFLLKRFEFAALLKKPVASAGLLTLDELN